VTDLAKDVTSVTIYDATPAVIGTFTDLGTNGSVQITLTRPLVGQERITAKATNAVGVSPSSDAQEVGIGNGPIMLGVGLRETGDAGALGTQGSNSGTIEWINVTTNALKDKFGVPVTPSNNWQTITFSAANGVVGYTGNDILSSPNMKGVLEHLAIWVNSTDPDRSSGPYEMYVDNVYNVGAGPGGSDFLITDFEGYTLGGEVLFQEPTYSGSSASSLAMPFGASTTSDEYANGGTLSQKLTWFWKDTNTGRWVRDTTDGVVTKPRPIVDLNYPIRMDILLRSGGVVLPNLTSVASKGTSCDLAIPLAATGTEPRSFAASTYRQIFTFDGVPPTNVIPVKKSTTAVPGPVADGSVTCTIAGNTLDCTRAYAPPAKYIFDLTGIAIGDPQIAIRMLVGDANADGITNGTDRTAIIGVWTGSGFSCVTDLNQDNVTNATDRTTVIGSWTSGNNTAP
jgi:hypothetical protein